MRRLILIAALLAAPFSSVNAQDDPRFELTPFGGYRFGGSFDAEGSDISYEVDDDAAYGLILNIRQQANTQWEILYSKQDTAAVPKNGTNLDPSVDIEIQVLQLGGTYQGDGEFYRPYIALTVGGTHIETTSGVDEDDTFFSASLGVGMNMFQSSNFGIRLEGRWYATLLDSSSNLFCRTGPDLNVCAVQIDGTTFNQFEVFGGLVFRF